MTPGNPGEPLREQPRIGVILGEPLEIVVERVEPGRGEHAGLAHRAAEHAPRAAGRAMSSRRPASRLPTGQPRPFDRATETRSKGAASSAKLRPEATAALNSRAPSR